LTSLVVIVDAGRRCVDWIVRGRTPGTRKS